MNTNSGYVHNIEIAKLNAEYSVCAMSRGQTDYRAIWKEKEFTDVRKTKISVGSEHMFGPRPCVVVSIHEASFDAGRRIRFEQFDTLFGLKVDGIDGVVYATTCEIDLNEAQKPRTKMITDFSHFFKTSSLEEHEGF